MKEYFFDEIDIKKENIYFPSGTVPLKQIDQFCNEYQKKMEE
jgi:glucosamine-6-phosphate deaminase